MGFPFLHLPFTLIGSFGGAQVARLELRKVKQVSRLELADKPLTIGRASANDVVLANTHVSRHHCVIERINGAAHIRDLQSHGGTFVNGKRISTAPLRHGDRISIGPFDLVFKDPDAPINVVDESDRGVRTVELKTISARQHDEQTRIVELQHKLDTLTSEHAQWRQNHETALQTAEHTEALLAETRDRAAHLSHELEVKSARVDELTEANRLLQERLDELAARSMQESEDLRCDLDATHREMGELRAHEAALDQQIEMLHAAHRAATENAEQAARALTVMRSQARTLDDAARQVAELQQRLEEIESAWVQVNEQLEDADPEDPDLLETAAAQRSHYSAELESLNQLRDQAVAQLSESAQQLRAIAERQTLQTPAPA